MASTDILVAKNDIPMGQAVSPGDMQWQAWPAGTAAGNFIRRTDQPSAIDQFSGNIARLPFVAGEPIREAKLVNAKGSGFMAAILPKGMRAIATQISAETGAGGFILPNDRVDVILSRRDREAEKQTGVEVQVSETILSNIRVLAIDQTVEEKNTQKNVIGKTATLELSERQAETLALAQKLGSLSLALRSITDASNEGPKEDDTTNASRAGVHIIRFGVGTVVTPK
jgi:pilus assembly protein CpaB